MKQTLIFCLFVVVLILSSTPALAETSKYQAGELIEEYVADNEISSTYGPYSYEGKDYFVVEVLPEVNDDYVSTLFIVDKTQGELVLNRNVYYGVSKMHMIALDIYESEPLGVLNDNLIVIREDISYWDDSKDFWDEIEDMATKTDEKSAANEASSICNELVVKFQDELQVSQNSIDALNDIYDDDVTDTEIDNYVDLKAQTDNNYKNSQMSVNKAIEKFPAIYDKFTDSSFAYGLKKSEWDDYEEHDLQYLGNLDDNYRVIIVNGDSYSWVQDDTDWSWESMNSKVEGNSTPGFGTISSAIMILVVAFFFRRE